MTTGIAAAKANAAGARKLMSVGNPKAERRLQESHQSCIRAVRSPSPLPSPSGRGSIVGDPFENASRLEFLERGPWVSLSLRERAGVRGNGPREYQRGATFAIASRNPNNTANG